MLRSNLIGIAGWWLALTGQLPAAVGDPAAHEQPPAIAGWWRVTPQHPDPCIEIRNPQARLTRPQLAWVTSLHQPIPVDRLIAAIGVPYCRLNDGTWTQPGQNTAHPAERLAYPLDSDPSTFLVVFIDKRWGDYRAYNFSFHHEGVF